MTGLTASGLVLRNGSDTVLVNSGATHFSFVQQYAAGTSYDVEVDTQPSGLECVPTHNTGVFGTTTDTVVITCAPPTTYTLTGTITGLTGNGLVLSNNGDTVSPVAGATSFTFTVDFGSMYLVGVDASPAGLTCTPSNESGVVIGNVTGVQVDCVPTTYTVSGSITGLKESGLSLKLGTETLNPAAGATSYAFTTHLNAGANYTIDHTDPPHSTCTVANASSTANANVTANVTCTYSAATVVSSSPQEGETQVSAGLASLTLTFDRAMNTSSVFTLSGGAGALGTPVWSNGDTTVTLPLSTPLERDHDYVLDFTAAKDTTNTLVSGTALGDGKLNFRTTFAHGEPIVDLDLYVDGGDGGVYTASYVSPTEPIDDSDPSCQAANSGDVAFTYTVHGPADGLIVDLSGSTIGSGDTVLSVTGPSSTEACDDDTGDGNQSKVTLSACFAGGETLSLVVDLYSSSTATTPTTWGTGTAKFTITEKKPASTTPTTFVPANGSTTARVTDDISVTFPAAVDVTAGGTLTATGSVSGPQTFQVSTAAVTVSNSNKTLTINPANFTQNETVTVTGHGLHYGDCEGQLLPDFTWTFTPTLAAIVTETEPNNTCATASGPYALPALVAGHVGPAGESDFFAFTLTSYSDVTIQTFDASGPSTCAVIDTVISLYDSTCGTALLADRDESGVGHCSKISAASDAAARHLAPGTYYVKVRGYSASDTFDYTLNVLATSTCGDGHVDGSEQCDGTAGCAADCKRVPTCNDGFIDAPETCEDGNTNDGDGCDHNCQLEGVTAEVEPNNTAAQADVTGIVITSDATLVGSIPTLGDHDLYKVVLAAPTVVSFETRDGTGAVACASIDTLIKLFASDGTTLVNSDDDTGIGSCSALTVPLAAGTYYLQVAEYDDTETIPAYRLLVDFIASAGSEVEANETTATATPLTLSTSGVYVAGGHQTGSDVDVYAITVPAGKSLRAEIIEGSGAETCESSGISSTLTLRNASGTSLTSNTTSGRGNCSLIDGTGASGTTAAHNLAAGTYYLEVKSTASGAAAQFDYDLVVWLR